MKIQVLIFLFLNNCFWNGTIWTAKKKILKPLYFFMDSLDCETAYKRIFKGGELSIKGKEKLAKQADNCLKEGKDKQAVFLLERLLKESKRQENRVIEIKQWENKLADLFFHKLKDHEKALKYYTSLLTRPLEPGERFFIQKHISESFFHLKKHNQALREVEKCFFDGISIQQEKEAVFLKARILIEKKDFEQAISFFEKQIEKFPEEEAFFREYLAFTYEAKKDLLSAIKELEKIEPSSLFRKKKIQRLRERQNNQPGF